MQVHFAQVPDHDYSDDKVFTTPNAVIVLDGASAFRPVPVPASVYADHLGSHLRNSLTTVPECDLRTVLYTSIQETAKKLELFPGHSPSSTVAIIRQHAEWVDGLVLGDTPIIWPSGVFSDDRIDDLNLPQRHEYRKRLARGTGYDNHHKQLLTDLQTEQARHRNREGGYWIAEATPEAAAHALTSRTRLDETPWVILATDGAFNTIQHLDLAAWATIAQHDNHQLSELLDYCQRWEAEEDPHGHTFPRSKRHDDKAIAVANWTSSGTT